MEENKSLNRFDFTPEGYKEAVEWIKSIGMWNDIKNSGFSSDGYSIVNEANSIYDRRNDDILKFEKTHLEHYDGCRQYAHLSDERGVMCSPNTGERLRVIKQTLKEQNERKNKDNKDKS